MEIKLPEEQMRAIVTKAILEGLGDEQKTLIMTAAVEHLLGQPESRSHYDSDKRNRLQRIFDGAAEQAMRKVAEEEFAKPENVHRMRELLGSTLEKALGESGCYIARSAVASAIASMLEKARD